MPERQVRQPPSLTASAFAGASRRGFSEYSFMFRGNWKVCGQIEVIINEYIHPNTSRSRIPQKNLQGGLAFAQLEGGYALLRERATESQTPDHLILRKAQSGTYLEQFFCKPFWFWAWSLSHQATPPVGAIHAKICLRLTPNGVNINACVVVARRS